jgi:membrane associated rhomboid family serine protease
MFVVEESLSNGYYFGACFAAVAWQRVYMSQYYHYKTTRGGSAFRMVTLGANGLIRALPAAAAGKMLKIIIKRTPKSRRIIIVIIIIIIIIHSFPVVSPVSPVQSSSSP